MRSTRSARSRAAASLRAALHQHPRDATLRQCRATPAARSTPTSRPGRPHHRHARHRAGRRVRSGSPPSRASDPGRRLPRRRDQPRRQPGAQVAVGHHAHHRGRLEPGNAAGQVRVVGQHRANAGHHRVMPPAQRVGHAARRLAGDPFALAARAWRCGRPASRRASASPAAGRAAPAEEPAFDFFRLGAQQPSSTSIPAPREPCDARRRPPAGRSRAPPTTTRATPASISASVQGGVRP